MDKPIHPDDIVARNGKEDQLGVVERTHADLDSHVPSPQRFEENRIKSVPGVSKPAFKQFLKDGIPPKDTVLVRWQNSSSAQLIQTSKVRLLDRSLLIGDVVKKGVRDAMSGVVVNTFTKCTLQPVHDVTYKDHTIKGLPPPLPLAPGFEVPATKPALIRDVSASELMETEGPKEEDLVIYKDWIGRVDDVVANLVIKLTDNCVVEIEEDLCEQPTGEFEAFAVGDIAVTKKGNLRNGKWIFGRYNPNTPPVGTVVETRAQSSEVAWLQRRIGSTNEFEPEAVLEREEMESQAFRIYDRTRRPAITNGHTSEIQNSLTSNSELDIRLGLRVRFKDLPSACAKYSDSLKRIERSATLGYDLNVFDVTRFTTDVTVQWQDLSFTTEHSTDLVPDATIEDEHAAWPGEIAHSLTMHAAPSMPGVEVPDKVGVVLSVKAAERMATVRWASDAVLHYDSGAGDDGSGVRSLLTGAVGVAAGEVEEVSLYEVEAPAAMNVRRGDLVLVANGGAPQPGSREVSWVGEIVDTCLDGTLRVRLGAAGEVRDVTLRREDVVVAVRSDGTGHMDDVWDDNGEDESEEFGSEYDDDEGEYTADEEEQGLAAARQILGEEGVARARQILAAQGAADMWDDDDEDDDMDSGDSDDSDESEEEPQARYEDENGNELDEEEVEGGDWDWESEDEEMPDAPAQATPPTSTSVTPPDTGAQENENVAVAPVKPADPSPASAPPQYLVLETPPPSSHHYATTPSTSLPAHLKRIQKEHRILQKPSALPSGVYVRTYESRLDLLRLLLLGPSDTPYAHAPFVVDFHLPATFPVDPPSAFFHSWPGENGLGGSGRVNPNLYEDGKICLSLLGTWEGSKGEGWKAGRSTMLQVVVSLLGLVLVREPYFNEAGYEALQGLEASRRPSALYNERTYLRARGFVVTALQRVTEDGAQARHLEDFSEEIRWEYLAQDGPRLLEQIIADMREVLERSDKGGEEPDGLTVMSKGACIPLRRVLERLQQLRQKANV